ncbi:MAG: hypothetical protein CMM84_16090 [Rhodothermaceae bacterium]|nr:hypothetical protein [Rhodothermaceae bacterium]
MTVPIIDADAVDAYVDEAKETFDTNAADKTTAFNTNATTRTGTFNTNAAAVEAGAVTAVQEERDDALATIDARTVTKVNEVNAAGAAAQAAIADDVATAEAAKTAAEGHATNAAASASTAGTEADRAASAADLAETVTAGRWFDKAQLDDVRATATAMQLLAVDATVAATRDMEIVANPNGYDELYFGRIDRAFVAAGTPKWRVYLYDAESGGTNVARLDTAVNPEGQPYVTLSAQGGSGVVVRMVIDWSLVPSGGTVQASTRRIQLGTEVVNGRPLLQSLRETTEANTDAIAALGGGAEPPAAVTARDPFTPVSGGLDVARRLLTEESPLVLVIGDSYANTSTDRVPFWLFKYLRMQAIRGLFLTKRESAGTVNLGGFWDRAQDVGQSGVIDAPFRYLEPSGQDERMGLPVWPYEIYFSSARLEHGSEGVQYRAQAQPADGYNTPFLTAADIAADVPVTFRVVGYAPHTAGALHDGDIRVCDRTSADVLSTVKPLSDLAPSPGSIYTFPNASCDNHASDYAAVALVPPASAGTAVGGDTYLHLLGALAHRPDRATGPVLGCMGMESWQYQQYAENADPDDANVKRFTDEDLEGLLSAIRLDTDQPFVGILHLNNQALDEATYRTSIERTRSRFKAAAEAAGFGEFAFVVLCGFAQGGDTSTEIDALGRAAAGAAGKSADTGYVSWYERTERLKLTGGADAVDFSRREGETALATTEGGDLLDGLEVHTTEPGAKWFGEVAADLITPAA